MAGNEREGGAAPVQVRGTVLTVRAIDYAGNTRDASITFQVLSGNPITPWEWA